MVKDYSIQGALDFLDSLQKSKSEITEAEYGDCLGIVYDYWADNNVATKVEDVIKSQLKYINLDDDKETLSSMLGDLECHLNILRDSDGGDGCLSFPVYAYIVNDYLSEQTFLKAKSEKNSSPVLFVPSFEFFYEDTVNPSGIDSCYTEFVEDVYLKGNDSNYYAVDISDSYRGDYHPGLAREEVDKLNGLIRGFSDGQNVVLNYDKNKPDCDVIDRSQEYDFDVLSNDIYIKNLYIDKGHKESVLVVKNSKTGEFEQQDLYLKNIDLYKVASNGFSDNIDILLGERINQQGDNMCVIFAKDEKGKFFLDAEFPAREAGTGFERFSYGKRGVTLSYQIEHGIDKSTDFRYVREKNGKSYLARRESGERGYTIVDKMYGNNTASKVSLEEKMKQMKARLNQKGLDMGKTGDSSTGEVSEKHKKVARSQVEDAKSMMLQKRMLEGKISSK